MTKTALKDGARRILDPIVGVLARLGVPALMVTLVGMIVSFYGATVVANGRLAVGGLLLLLSGLCDVLDGDLARRANTVSRFGAFIDSTLDRVTEFAYFGAIVVYIVNRPGGFHNMEVVIVLTALSGSVLTSYARARAEGIGVECRVGILERPERITLLILGLFLGYRVLEVVVALLAVASVFTFLQRIVHVHRSTKVPSQ